MGTETGVNVNRVTGALKAGIIKRLKKFGLTDAKIHSAVHGEEIESVGKLKLSAKMRKYLMAYVHQNGPIVVAGRKALKIYSVETYDSARKATSKMARKHAPWARVREEKEKATAS